MTMERLTMMVSMQMMGLTTGRNRAATPAEVDSFVVAAVDALRKCYDKAGELEALERKAEAARYGAPR